MQWQNINARSARPSLGKNRGDKCPDLIMKYDVVPLSAFASDSGITQ